MIPKHVIHKEHPELIDFIIDRYTGPGNVGAQVISQEIDEKVGECCYINYITLYSILRTHGVEIKPQGGSRLKAAKVVVNCSVCGCDMQIKKNKFDDYKRKKLNFYCPLCSPARRTKPSPGAASTTGCSAL